MTKGRSNRPTKKTITRANKVRQKRRVFNSQTKSGMGNEIESLSSGFLRLK